MREVDQFSTTVCRKLWQRPLAYTLGGTITVTQAKRLNALIRAHALRAKRICSSLEHWDHELVKVKRILQRNGYPRPIIEQTVKPCHTVVNSG